MSNRSNNKPEKTTNRRRHCGCGLYPYVKREEAQNFADKLSKKPKFANKKVTVESCQRNPIRAEVFHAVVRKISDSGVGYTIK